MRLKGWMGRADQTTKVRGMFVHPGQVADIARRHRSVKRARLSVDRDQANDTMTLAVEVAAGERSSALETAIAESIQAVTKLRGRIVFADPGALPNDGKIIEDLRKYD
jgi:phenylacetate-CoA ligase